MSWGLVIFLAYEDLQDITQVVETLVCPSLKDVHFAFLFLSVTGQKGFTYKKVLSGCAHFKGIV